MESNELPSKERGSGEAAGTSAENLTHREQLLRDDARFLQIPQESLSHETVRSYVGVHLDTATLQRYLMRNASASDIAFGAALLARYSCSEYLLRGALHLLREGFHGRRPDRNYLKTKLGIAARYYGLGVVVTDEQAGEGRQFLPPPKGMWHTDHTPPPLTRHDSPPPQERYDPAHMPRLALEADRYGIAEGMITVDPVLHDLLTHIADAKDLVRRTESAAALPEAPGLYPTAQERLARVAHLSRAVVAVLAEEPTQARCLPRPWPPSSTP